MALYILIGLISCLFGMFVAGLGILALAYVANKRIPAKEQVVEIDPELLAEVLAEKLELEALTARTKIKEVKTA